MFDCVRTGLSSPQHAAAELAARRTVRPSPLSPDVTARRFAIQQTRVRRFSIELSSFFWLAERQTRLRGRRPNAIVPVSIASQTNNHQTTNNNPISTLFYVY
jgi:hypothetical protein